MSPRQWLAAAAVLNLLCAPVSWIDDGLTPSWVVYPLALGVGLWRLSRGKGVVWLGVSAIVFVLVHLPWTLAWISGEHPLDADLEYSPVQWVLTLFVAPALLVVAAALAWRKGRKEAAGTLAA